MWNETCGNIFSPSTVGLPLHGWKETFQCNVSTLLGASFVRDRGLKRLVIPVELENFKSI